MGRSPLRAELLTVIENQLREYNPPETQQTLTRLLAAGYSREAAVARIGSALAEEIWGMMREQRVFDPAHYHQLLDQIE